MNLVKCKSCGQEVANTADQCPNCGTKYPGAGPKEIIMALTFIGAVGWGIIALLSDGSPPEQTVTTPTKTPEQIAEDTKACRADIDCWAKRNRPEATVQCDGPVEQQAAFSYEWTNSFVDPKFPQYRWLDKEHGWVTYQGAQIKFQNQYGAWINVVYECDYNTINKMVLDIRVQQGNN